MKHTVLLVDDDRSNLYVLSDLLDGMVRLLSAESGPQALSLLQEYKEESGIQLIISDQRMPGMSGVEFLLQSVTYQPNAKRILLTGYEDTGAIIKLVNEGQLYQYIRKPFDHDEFLTTIKRALEAISIEQHNMQLVDELQELNAHLEKQVEKRTEQQRDMLAELRKTLLQLRQAHLTQDRLLSIITQDLRKHMEVFMLSSESIVDALHQLEDTTLDEHTQGVEKHKARGLAGNINTMATRLHRQTENVLDWSLLQKEELPSQHSTFPLFPLFQSVVSSYKEALEHKLLSLHTHIDEHVVLNFDPKACQIILRNLLANAIQHSPQGGEIQVWWRPGQESKGTFSIEDKGPGITPEKLRELRQPKPLASGQFSTHQGLGLGLPLSQELLARCGSELLIENRQEGGVKVSFSMPLSQEGQSTER